MNRLIIAEKPSVAVRLALSLAEDGKPKRLFSNGVSYYQIEKGGDSLFVVAAAGHLFTVKQAESATFPVFKLEWVPSYKANKNSYFTKKYLDVIKYVGEKCTGFVNACDYDVEGTVIGTNIIKYVMYGDVNSTGDLSDVGRMKFSTTTKPDLVRAYESMEGIDIYNYYAGESRHMLDWMWGINLSRALMSAVNIGGIKKVLSIGRIQGPTLSILAQRELEIKNFESRPYWKVLVLIGDLELENRKGSFFAKEEAETALKVTSSSEMRVKEIKSEESRLFPFPPFDLTSMQLEANRVFRIDPSRTLAIAQSLYEKSYISYPRTASQKLPSTINFQRIIAGLSKMEAYAKDAEEISKKGSYRPIEGAKKDEAHPAIYPTGEVPSGLGDEEMKIYDLVARRFLSCFREAAVLLKSSVVLSAGGEEYAAQGLSVKERGWLATYRHYAPKEASLPQLEEGSPVKPDKVHMKEGKTEPPRRYTKASLIALLEKKNLGTKATRTEVIDTLFRRDYVKGSSIEVTALGMSIYEALSGYCKEILDEELTRKLEGDMEEIAKGKLKEGDALKEGRDLISKIIEEFKVNESSIGKELAKGFRESELSKSLGKCKCGGNLMLKRSKAGKNFVGCTNWPQCTITYPVPQNALIVPTGKVCEMCNTPKVKVFRRGKRVFEMDLDPLCKSKEGWAAPKASAPKEIQPAVQMQVPAPEAAAAKAKTVKKKRKALPKKKPRTKKKA
jgi:DNA topoisomerase-1